MNDFNAIVERNLEEYREELEETYEQNEDNSGGISKERFIDRAMYQYRLTLMEQLQDALDTASLKIK